MAAGLLLWMAWSAAAQSGTLGLDWRQIGNTSLQAQLPGPASGPVSRVWYSADGERLYALTASGVTFSTVDGERWERAEGNAPPLPAQPEFTPAGPSGARVVAPPQAGSVQRYALGSAVLHSEDGGLTWEDRSSFRGVSILGGGLTDLAVSPANEQEVVVAGRFGIWRSVDGGRSWMGLNQGLPNLPAVRLLRLPGGGKGARILLSQDGSGPALEAEWSPGEKTGWVVEPPSGSAVEDAFRRTLSQRLGEEVFAFAAAGGSLYAGGREGRLWASGDAGATWRSFDVEGAGDAARIFADPAEPRVAIVAFRSGPGQERPVLLARTMNGGIFWDDMTGNLPRGNAHAAEADLESGAVYAATDRGLYMTYAPLRSAGPVEAWTRLGGSLPEAAVLDVKLDAGHNQLFVALQGYGVYGAMAPHRFRSPSVVRAADYTQGPAAPGSLLSVLGKRITAAKAGMLDIPILAAGEHESQIQVPFEASGTSLALALLAAGRQSAPLRFRLPLLPSAPAIFVDRDGMPMVLDADSGVLLDGMNPARSGARIQILASGLGKVTPEWPAGLPAPLENPPRVTVPVRAYLDRRELEVTRATLAPGYAGFYLVEVVLPAPVNAGPGEFYLESGGRQSNRVSVPLEP